MKTKEAQVCEVRTRSSLVFRLVVLFIIAIAILMIWVSKLYLTERFTQEARQSAELRMTLHADSIVSLLLRLSFAPIILSRDPVLTSALGTRNFTAASTHLIKLNYEFGAQSLFLMDVDGQVVAATDVRQIGSNQKAQNFFEGALLHNDTIFTSRAKEADGLSFHYSRQVIDGEEIIGVVVVEVDFSALEQQWLFASETILVADLEDNVILASEPHWRNKTVADALKVPSAPGVIGRLLQSMGDGIDVPENSIAQYSTVLRLEKQIGFQGWRLIYFATDRSVRERVSALLALEIMAIAMIVAIFTYIYWLRALRQRPPPRP